MKIRGKESSQKFKHRLKLNGSHNRWGETKSKYLPSTLRDLTPK